MDTKVQDIKAEIHRLRFGEGMTLQEIANKFGKSIYWVNARLNINYEPKRTRQTADDIGVFDDLNISDEVLAAEVSQIRELRERGLTYEEIASNLNRSVYWVHTRLQGKYRPKGARAEKQFQEERVVPYMSQIGFTGILQYVRTSKGGITQEADIIATLDGKQYITEVKVRITHHQLQTAIGQLTLYHYTYDEEVELQIALPKEANLKKLPKGLIDHLAEKENIHLLFVP
jgi:transcriptional regulator with XRE-family HTH domain